MKLDQWWKIHGQGDAWKDFEGTHKIKLIKILLLNTYIYIYIYIGYIIIYNIFYDKLGGKKVIFGT